MAFKSEDKNISGLLSSAKSLEERYSADVLKGFVNGLIKRLPTLEEFKKSFQSIGWSKINEYHKDISQKRRAQIALETLEAIESKSWTIEKSYTIEHLNPDSAERKNANIGKLTLLEASANEKKCSENIRR